MFDREPVTTEAQLTGVLEESALTGARAIGLRLLSYGIGLVASILIARALGPEGRGLYAYPVVLLGIVMALGHIGFEDAQVFLASQGATTRRLWSNATVAGVLIGLTLWGIIAVAFWVGGQSLSGGLPFSWIAITLSQIPILLQTLYWSGVLRLRDRLIPATRAVLLGVALHAAATGLLVATGSLTPFRVLALSWLANGSAWLALFAISSRMGLIGDHPDWKSLFRGVVFGLKTHIGHIFFFLLLRVDQVMVRSILGFRALGLYSLAVVVGELIWMVTDPLAASLLPHQVRAQGEDHRRLGYAMGRLSFTISMILAVVAWVIAPLGIRFVYGPDFTGAVWPFRLLLPGIVALTASRPLGVILLREGRPWVFSLLAIPALLLNVAANMILLTALGAAGASVASSGSYVLVAVGLVIATRKKGIADWKDLRPTRADFRLLLKILKERPSSAPR